MPDSEKKTETKAEAAKLPPPPPVPALEPKLASFTVAPGRTVLHTPHVRPGEPPEFERSYGPGESIEMPLTEGARLRDLGFLVDPTGAQRVALGGPALRNDV